MAKDSVDNVIRTMLDEDPNGWSWRVGAPSFRIFEHSCGVHLVFTISSEWVVPFGRWQPEHHQGEYPFDYIKIGRRLSWRLNGMRKEAIRAAQEPSE